MKFGKTRAPDLHVLLLAESEADIRLVQRALDENEATAMGQSCALVIAMTLAQAVELLNLGGVDVIVSGLSLPDSRDLITLTSLRSSAPDVPVVILTDAADESLALQAVRSGAQDYLIKSQVTGSWLVRALRYAVERQRMQAAVRSLALVDELTGLYNRRGFMTVGEQQLSSAARMKRPVLATYLDVDGLKLINDKHGHREGDAALCRVAEILRKSFRVSDIIGRLGGDEFTVLASNAPAPTAPLLLRRIEANIHAINQREPATYEISVSIGIASFDPDEDSPSLAELIARADVALYEQKRVRTTRI